MTMFSNWMQGSSGVDTGDIGHSLRFRSAASAYLNRTPASSGNLKTWTMSMWVKRGTLSTGAFALFGTGANNTNDTICYFGPSGTGDQLDIIVRASSVVQGRLTTNQLFRDPTSHMHVVFVYDSPQVTAADRMKLFINGVRVTSFSTETQPAQNTETLWNTARALYLGRLRDDSPNYLDGYLSRICFVDGTALTPSSFGQFNTEINEWVSKSQSAVKAVVDAGGTNSFMLDFDDVSTSWSLGKDFRNATVLSGITCTTTNASNSVTAITGATQPQVGQQLQCANFSGGIAYVAAVGGSSGAWTATMDRNANASGTGVSCVFSGNGWSTNALFSLSGSTYDHMLDVPGNSYATLNSIYPSAANITNGNLTSGTTAVRAAFDAIKFDSKWEVTAGASAVTAGVISGTGTTNTTSVTANKVFAFRLTTAGALDYKNVTDAGSWTSITTGLIGTQYPYGITQAANWNFGQAPLHASATYQAAAGGYFFDTTPGYKALCQANLATPAILNPEDHMDVVTVTKSGNTNFTIPWDASTYDTFFEIRRRDATGDWYQIDGLRGYDKILKSNSTAAETTDANVLGISGTTGTLKSTLADGTYVVTMHKAGLTASRQTNTDGSITSTVSRNVDSGFAIVTYTGTGANATVGHGLGKAPSLVIVKGRSNALGSWTVWHGAFAGTEYIYLNGTAAKGTAAGYWNSTTPTSTAFSVGTLDDTNKSAATQVAYCHADIPGYSKAFSYTGAGATTDNAYVDVGFKIKSADIKCSSTTGNWVRMDTVCNTYNVAETALRVNTSESEGTVGTTYDMDFTAFGIKHRASNVADVTAAQTYIGIAYADVAGKYSLGR